MQAEGYAPPGLPATGVHGPPGLEPPTAEDWLASATGIADGLSGVSAAASSTAPAGSAAEEPEFSGKGTRKRIFERHLNEDEISAGLASGALIRGTLRVSSSKLGMAFVKPDGAKSNDRDLVVRGKFNRNRAVHGDVVIVQPILYGRREGESSSAEEEDDNVCSKPSAFPGSSDSEEELVFDAPILRGVDEPKASSSSKKACRDSSESDAQMAKVVAIADGKGQKRVIVCTLHPIRAGTKGDPKDGRVRKDDTFIKAIPTDKRMPTILVQINDVTRKALKLPGKLDRFQLWPLQIMVWNESSEQPLGRLKGSCLGQAGSLQAEERHALIENELDDHDVDFPEEELDEVDAIVLEAQKNFKEEVRRRHDLQRWRIFTIDPATAKDLDDAIHVEDLPSKNQIEVGVHIADVGHFLKLGTVTDTEAQRRTTSVYLIGRVLPMLPHGLCNHLCSLNPNEPKLAFSAFFRLCKKTGNLIENPPPWFEKTAISSVCRLNYEEAQDVIDGVEMEEPPQVYGGYTWQQIKDDIMLLYDVCGKVRTGRLEGGAMTISKMKMIFHTRESEDGTPNGYHLESHSASHWVIEELMLLANRCVAKHLARSVLSDVSVLRNHKAPDAKKAANLEKLMKDNLGIKEWNMGSSTSIYRSCQDIYRKFGSMLGLCVEMMTMRAGMKQAEYFVYGEGEGEEEQSPHHFALNFDYYTHFTSPIRRYPDVMVHRVLCALLEGRTSATDGGDSGAEGSEEETDKGPVYFQTRDKALEKVGTCNSKKTASRRCQEQLDRAVFCIYLRSMKSWFYTVGTVLAFHRTNKPGGDTVTVYCSQLGRESKARLCKASEEELEGSLELFIDGVDDELLLPDNWEWRGRGCLELHWQPPSGRECERAKVQQLKTLSCVPIVIIPTNTVPIDYSLFFVSPWHKKFDEVAGNISEDEVHGFDWTEVDEEGTETLFAEYDENAPTPGID
eukprot:TRINITY_DN41027_c0_g1_i1.p1 TRINITY_DN41027_c0_g1~~TRINITY_DN41027_c0_g1_i1.p1  ORF type:complete len:957 (-),score=249.16 TRINITY_DN41027_c0_g1_i1:38-2908(-)